MVKVLRNGKKDTKLGIFDLLVMSGKRTEKGKDYKFTKTERGIERLSHYVYRMNTGKEVPKNYCIRFKDGDSMNCDFDNLLCISRSENARMNYNREAASKTMLIKSAGGYINALLMGKI
jgi:hypothetical protein